MASEYKEYEKAWNKVIRLDFLRDELRKEERKGRYAQARRRRVEEEIAMHERYLTPAARSRAALWKKRVFDAAREVRKARSEQREPPLSFPELVAHVLKLPDLPGEETVVRYLNHIGFHGSPGRHKKS